ncbi:MAG: molybdopterin-binding protein [Deltaproteobacteria bacterium]|nr:molybdopterin-binding protein [Deltaproteobacteria bacterium]
MASKYKSSAKSIPVEQSVGTVLAHDITEIRPGLFKGPAFKKGHIITEDDLPHLRRIGKEHIFILHMEPGEVHENDAALRLSDALAGKGIVFDPDPSEGKISFKSASRGLLKVNVDALIDLNLVPDISCSSRHNNSIVEKGEIIAAVRTIPLIIEGSILDIAVKVAEKAGGIFSLKTFSQLKTGLVITGSEVYTGLINDNFAPIIKEKLRSFDCPVMGVSFAPDNEEIIVDEIKKCLKGGAEMIMVAGGMSVDPDDVTRSAISKAGAEDLVYGTPVLPGAMFLYGRFGNIPVLGLPACILYYKTTVLDLILPRVLAGETITRKDLATLAHGGLCLNCGVCRFPVCPFGK